MLEHHPDSQFTRMLWIADYNRGTTPFKHARIGMQQTVNHFDEGRFASAIFTKQRMNFSSANSE